MNKEMLREASFYNKNVQLDIRSAHDSNELQIRQIDSLVKSGIDLLVVAPNEAAALTPTIEEVMQKGIPVIVVDRKINSEHYTAFVGADNYSIGKDIGSYVVQELNGEGTVVELTGRMASTAANERHRGFHDALRQEPDVKVLAHVEVGWEGPRVKQQLDSLFDRGIVPQLLTAPNDRTGVRIHEALLELGHPEIKVIGVDGLSAPGGGLDNVEHGQLQATFVYPTGGDKVIQIALHILKKEPFARDTQLRSALINANTARIFRIQSDQVKEGEQRIDQLGMQMDKFLSRYSMQNMLLIACIAIILLIGIMLAMGIRSYYNTLHSNEELAQQKRKLEEQRDQLVKLAKEIEENTQNKLSFFAEVSHDLRSPLTLIVAPIEQLLTMSTLTVEQRDLLQTAHNNANILLRLVGEMLDFRKFEAGKLQLDLSELRIDQALEQWCKPFRSLAKKKMIRYSVTCSTTVTKKEWTGQIDQHKMESVVYNILSNAFKYTPEGGKISVTANITHHPEQGKRLHIVVEDTGQGIERDKLPHIFDRFYQADASHDGSGIGLATVKAYVELHGGTVKAESVPGKGTRFIVIVPCDETALAQKAHVYEETKVDDETAPALMPQVEEEEEAQSVDTPAMMDLSDESESTEATDKPTVLIIDDNEDIRNYLKHLLSTDYVVETAVDGQDGLNKARQIIPDAVVCDVMMPVMDGWECCRRLKDEWQTSHIPVMMLTACTLDEQRVKGFDCGADAYIAKPFSPDMFKARLRNLIANRSRLKAFFTDQTAITTSDVSELDKGFAERLRKILEDNLKNADFNVEDMASEMGMARSQLYRKVKSLMGYTPNELLRVARLKKAAELLRRTEMSVAEIAYEVGFSTPSYLTRCFKEYFGVKPKEY